jgi:hypothetical protein
MSVEYLDNCYNNGIKITNIIGEDKVIETIENVEVTDTKLFDELNDIITKDEELSSRLETLKEINKEQNPDWEYPIICLILLILIFPILLWFQLFMQLSMLFWDYTIISILTNIIAFIPLIPTGILVIALTNFQCFGEPYRLNIDMNINRS